MAKKVNSILSDYYFLRLLDMYGKEGIKVLALKYPNEPKYARYNKYAARVEEIFDEERGCRIYKEIGTNNKFTIETTFHPGTSLNRVLYNIKTKAGSYSFIWDNVDNTAAINYNMGSMQACINGAPVSLKEGLKAFTSQECQPLYSWKDIEDIFLDGHSKNIIEKNMPDGTIAAYDKTSGLTATMKKEDQRSISNRTGIEYISIIIGNYEYKCKYQGHKYFINDKPVNKDVFMAFFRARISSFNEGNAIIFSDFSLARRISQMDELEIEERYKGRITRQEVESLNKEFDEEFLLINHITSEILKVQRNKKTDIYTIITTIGTYRIDASLRLLYFNGVQIGNGTLFFNSLKNKAIPSDKSVFDTWDKVLEIAENGKSHGYEQLEKETNASSKEEECTYEDVWYNHWLVVHKENDYISYTVCINNNTYKFKRDLTTNKDSYYINGEEVTPVAFIECYNDKTTLNVIEPICNRWPDLLTIEDRVNDYSATRLTKTSSMEASEAIKYHKGYIDNFFGHKVEIIKQEIGWFTQKLEIKVYVGEITYQYSGTIIGNFDKERIQYFDNEGREEEEYRINGTPVSQQAFIEHFNSKTAPNKVIHQVPPVKPIL